MEHQGASHFCLETGRLDNTRDKVTGPLITCFTPPVSGTVITNFANTNFNTGTVEQSNSGTRVESGQSSSSSRGSNKQNKQTNSSANYCDRDK